MQRWEYLTVQRSGGAFGITDGIYFRPKSSIDVQWLIEKYNLRSKEVSNWIRLDKLSGGSYVLDELIESLGALGWEAVSHTPVSTVGTDTSAESFFFKRPIEE